MNDTQKPTSSHDPEYLAFRVERATWAISMALEQLNYARSEAADMDPVIAEAAEIIETLAQAEATALAVERSLDAVLDLVHGDEVGSASSERN